MLHDETEELAPSHVRPQVSGRYLTTLLSFSEGSIGSARIVFRKAAAGLPYESQRLQVPNTKGFMPDVVRSGENWYFLDS
jgi:hypothetical protein